MGAVKNLAHSTLFYPQVAEYRISEENLEVFLEECVDDHRQGWFSLKRARLSFSFYSWSNFVCRGFKIQPFR